MLPLPPIHPPPPFASLVQRALRRRSKADKQRKQQEQQQQPTTGAGVGMGDKQRRSGSGAGPTVIAPLRDQVYGGGPLTEEQKAEGAVVSLLALVFAAILVEGVFLAASVRSMRGGGGGGVAGVCRRGGLAGSEGGA